MAEDSVSIEIDGVPVQARRGQMLIEVTDANGSYVPRFCYHDKLSVAANCRMCLVEVEKAPKPLPACATPVVDGMKVHTKSDLAKETQKSVMEFLLINHPLDCPICDQGGECELQDLAMGYGSDVSRYQESKRVVKDKNIGPLVQTEMTRCIHCTRCVRFGEEIAGLRELGATGRGEDMQIGTYIEKSMASELSGNVIDLCPVGALTSKPFRFSARTWEMSQHPGIAAHDSVGSNLYFHVKDGRIKRVVPAENEAINEVWLSDRDRFSYEGLYSDARLLVPMIKQAGSWQEVDWETALAFARQGLGAVIEQHGAEKIGALVAPTASTEEAYLLQKLLRALGSSNIDCRLRQSDFSDQEAAPVFPWLGQTIAELEQLDAALIIGGWPRKEQPLLNHRLRKAALKGADVMLLDALDQPFNYALAEKLILPPDELASALAAIAAALPGAGDDEALSALLGKIRIADGHRRMAEKLHAAGRATVLLGNLAAWHPQAATLRYLAGKIAQLAGANLGYLGEAANSAGAALAGALPHRGVAGKPDGQPGLHTLAMFEAQLSAYVLLNVEPDMDCCAGALATQALQEAQCVVAMSAYKSAALLDCANVLLPIAQYAENEGSYVNAEGRRQHFQRLVAAPGEARPAWKILKVLADALVDDAALPGFDFSRLSDLAAELDQALAEVRPHNPLAMPPPDAIAEAIAGAGAGAALQRVSTLPMNAVDALVRRASALQQSGEVADGALHLNPALAKSLGVGEQTRLRAEQGERSVALPVLIDERLPERTVLIHGGQAIGAELGPWYGEIRLSKI